MERPSQDSGGNLPLPGDRDPVAVERTSEPRPQTVDLDPAAQKRSIAQVTSVLACVTAITLYVHLGAHRKAKPAASVVPAAALAAGEALPKAKMSQKLLRRGLRKWPLLKGLKAPPEIDQAAVALAEAELDAASRDRARADERASSSSTAARTGHEPGGRSTRPGRGSSLFWFATLQRGSPRLRPAADSCGESATRFRSSCRPSRSFRGRSRPRS